jgi:DNA polymerase elongation subunit (family B)
MAGRKRSSYYLKPRKPKAPKQKHYIGFDIETDATTPQNPTILICIANDDIKLSFRSIADFMQEIDKHKYRSYTFVATNLGFDFWGVFQDFPDRVKMIERNGRIYKLTYYQGGRQTHPVHFVDTLNYFPTSVKKLGEITNTSKLDHPDFFPARPQTDQQWQELTDYCIRDAYISYTFMQHVYFPWVAQNMLTIKTTMASTSLCDFQTNDLQKTLFVNSPQILDIVFKAYYGGRTETFRRGYVKKVWCYDFNSLYPSCMVEDMPDPNTAKYLTFSDMNIINKYNGFTYIEGFQPKTFIPLLPMRRDGQLLFPWGEIQGYYSHIEIREALKQGFVLKTIGEGVMYTRNINLFAQFVKRHYARRLTYKKEGNPLEVMEKLAMNSLYGKFGFKFQESSSYVSNSQPLDLENYEHMSIKPCDGYTYVRTYNNTEPCVYSFPELSAHITAIARLKLYKKLRAHQQEIIYCDTDSIFITSTLPDETQLGGLKLEKGYPKSDNMFIRAKFYRCGNDVKAKGVTNMTTAAFERVLEGKTITQTRFVKYRTAFRSTVLTTETKRVNELVEIHKELSIEDTKRQWFQPFHPEYLQISEPVEIKNGSVELGMKETQPIAKEA